MLKDRRWANAEAPLRKATNHKDASKLTPQTRIHLMMMLETSLMAQNKYAAFNEHTNQTLRMLESYGLKPSETYGISLMNQAEALYNLGKQDEALKLANASYAMLQALTNANPKAISSAKANIEQYQANLPSEAIWPQDMSEFFTTCESIKAGTDLSTVRQRYTTALEVGKQYTPTGVMKEIFATALPVGFDKQSVEGLNKTIFIPNKNQTADWCIVFDKNNAVQKSVVSAD